MINIDFVFFFAGRCSMFGVKHVQPRKKCTWCVFHFVFILLPNYSPIPCRVLANGKPKVDSPGQQEGWVSHVGSNTLEKTIKPWLTMVAKCDIYINFTASVNAW